MPRSLVALLLSFAVLALTPQIAGAAGTAYPDADWSEAWIPSSDGVTLHADVLRPKGATDATKTPVVLSIGPYFNHSGQTGPAGPAEGTQVRPGRPECRPVGALPGLRRGLGAAEEGLQLRDGGPARLRRLERVPRLVRARRAEGRGHAVKVGGGAAVVHRQRSGCTASPMTP